MLKRFRVIIFSTAGNSTEFLLKKKHPSSHKGKKVQKQDTINVFSITAISQKDTKEYKSAARNICLFKLTKKKITKYYHSEKSTRLRKEQSFTNFQSWTKLTGRTKAGVNRFIPNRPYIAFEFIILGPQHRSPNRDL